MDEKRKAKRLKEESEVTITIISFGGKPSKEKVIYNYSNDISASGARIHANIFLPVDTMLKMDIKLKNLQQMITAMGKVKWIKVVCEDESYAAGVEFVHTPAEAIKKIADYVAWRLNDKRIK
ncbi:MAG TPA: PilZ domain-containing protein [Smithella sp.]|nr:PilZ domain-containing protein [Smithella sp.]